MGDDGDETIESLKREIVKSWGVNVLVKYTRQCLDPAQVDQYTVVLFL